jgi:hypothetical protein
MNRWVTPFPSAPDPPTMSKRFNIFRLELGSETLNLYGLLPGMLDCATVEKIVGPFSSKK